MNKAIYIQREDGDWDFVAAFSTEQLPDKCGSLQQWPEQVAEYFEKQGESVVIIKADLPLLPDILDGDSPLLPFNPSPIERQDIHQN
jgi:hypothetical protein